MLDILRAFCVLGFWLAFIAVCMAIVHVVFTVITKDGKDARGEDDWIMNRRHREDK